MLGFPMKIFSALAACGLSGSDLKKLFHPSCGLTGKWSRSRVESSTSVRHRMHTCTMGTLLFVSIEKKGDLIDSIPF
jgi:hypothetical protein